MKREILAGLTAVTIISIATPASATQYVQITGQLTNAQGSVMGGGADVVIAGTPKAQISSSIDSSGHYSLKVPSGVDTQLTFVVYEPGYGDDNGSGFSKNAIRNNPGFSNWGTDLPGGFTENTNIDLQLPSPVKLNLTVTDAQSHTLTNSIIQIGQERHDAYQSGGFTWNGDQGVLSSIGSMQSLDGNFQFFLYPISKMDIIYCLGQSAGSPFCSSGQVISPTFPLLADSTYQLCLPINLGVSNSTPSTCIDEVLAAADRAAADRAAADKAAADRAAADRAAADRAAADRAAADRARIMTITCTKGKVNKKVTAVKPICPSGFKKKK